VSVVVLAPLVLFIVYLGGWWYLGLVALASLVGNHELYALLRRAGYKPIWPFGFALSLAFLLDAGLSPVFSGQIQTGLYTSPVLAFSLILSLAYLVIRNDMGINLADWAMTWVPPLYVGFIAAFWVYLRSLPEGSNWVYFAMGISWATDIAAYAAGMLFGKRRFFPRISPRKTVEGAVGGIAAGTLLGGILAWFFGWDLSRLLVMAVIGSIAAEVGDLAESLIKRQLRAKDASRLIPGHGGLLDRLDSLLFVGVVVYFGATWAGVGVWR